MRLRRRHNLMATGNSCFATESLIGLEVSCLITFSLRESRPIMLFKDGLQSFTKILL